MLTTNLDSITRAPTFSPPLKRLKDRLIISTAPHSTMRYDAFFDPVSRIKFEFKSCALSFYPGLIIKRINKKGGKVKLAKKKKKKSMKASKNRICL